MDQLSFFGAEAVPPSFADLEGVLAAHGQVVTSGDAARISVVLADAWRVTALHDLFDRIGLDPEVTRTDEGTPLVRTALTTSLHDLAVRWTRGAVKSVPADWVPDGPMLRMWAVTSVRVEVPGQRYVLGLDPHAPQTRSDLARSLLRAGIAPTLIGTRGGRPGLRVSGRRRLARLVENIGAPPVAGTTVEDWPSTA